MRKITLAGVPEHFNYPWIQAIESGLFQENGFDVQWTNVPEGTGKLGQLLREGSTDLAIVLTEGILKDISLGNPSVIVQKYVESPLLWGIHVAASSPYYTLADLENKTAAISRIGSGSQLMAYVNANNQGWDRSIKFEIVHTIDGAVQALTSQKADYFMWEHFMTKPLVDQGVFRRLADCPTPWPCFVIAVRNEILENQPEIVAQILEVINTTTSKFKSIPAIDSTLAQNFDQKKEDIQEWLTLTEWSQKPLTEKMLNKVQNQLFDLKIINKKGTLASIVKTI